MSADAEFERKYRTAFLKAMHDPTLENVNALAELSDAPAFKQAFHDDGTPVSQDIVRMAGIHKARLVWPGSTWRMRYESRRWLKRNGFKYDGAGVAL